MIVERNRYKGWPVIILKRDADDKYPLVVGLSKAKLIVEAIGEIGQFLNRDCSPDVNAEGETSSVFKIRCSTAIFSDEEIELLKKTGKRLDLIIKGLAKPSNDEELNVLNACSGNTPPSTVLEKVWRKYQRRLDLEKNPNSAARVEWRDPGEEWFSRSAVGNLAPGPKRFRKRRK